MLRIVESPSRRGGEKTPEHVVVDRRAAVGEEVLQIGQHGEIARIALDVFVGPTGPPKPQAIEGRPAVAAWIDEEMGEIGSGPAGGIHLPVGNLAHKLKSADRRGIEQAARRRGRGQLQFQLGGSIGRQAIIEESLHLTVTAAQLFAAKRARPRSVAQRLRSHGTLPLLDGRAAVGAMRAIELMNGAHDFTPAVDR